VVEPVRGEWDGRLHELDRQLALALVLVHVVLHSQVGLPCLRLQLSQLPYFDLLLILRVLFHMIGLGLPCRGLLLVTLKHHQPLLQEPALHLVNRLRRVGQDPVLRGALDEEGQHLIRLFNDACKRLILSFNSDFLFDVIGPLSKDPRGHVSRLFRLQVLIEGAAEPYLV